MLLIIIFTFNFFNTISIYSISFGISILFFLVQNQSWGDVQKLFKAIDNMILWGTKTDLRSIYYGDKVLLHSMGSPVYFNSAIRKPKAYLRTRKSRRTAKTIMRIGEETQWEVNWNISFFNHSCN